MIKGRLAAGAVLAAVAVAIAMLAGAAQGAKGGDPSHRTGAPHAKTFAGPSGGTTNTLQFSTATSAKNVDDCGDNSDAWNQGWWSSAESNDDCNSNYVVGMDPPFGPWNDYFTFDINAWSNRCAITEAHLLVNEADGGNQALFGTGPTSANYALFDASTDAETLSDKEDNPNTSIYDDLGSGVMYGGATLPTTTSGNWRSVPLNANGVNALMTAHRNRDQFFSIGGTILNNPGNAFLFGDSGSDPVYLVVTQYRICKV